MTPLKLDGWDVETMATSHYRGSESEGKRELGRFIRKFLAEFHADVEFKSTLPTPLKIKVFHTYVESRFKREHGQQFDDEVSAGAWFLAFLCFWHRNRGYVEREVQPIMRKSYFYQTMINEWDSQRSKGTSTDSILLYTITHPRLSQNPYLTIPVRIEHVRRIRVYWNKDPKILNDCRSHLNICKSELKLLDEKTPLTCSAAPGKSHWLKIQVELQQQLCDLREVSKSQFSRDQISYHPKHEQFGKHEKIYGQVMELWELINHHRLSAHNMDDDLKYRSDEVRKFIEDVRRNGEISLSNYLDDVWGGERRSVEKRDGDVASGNRDPTPEYYLRVYFKAIMSVVKVHLAKQEEQEIKNLIKPESSALNHSLRDSIFPLPNSTYPVRTPDLGKKVSSAAKIVLITKDGNSVEDKSKSSLINDCRDSVKLALFLLEKIQLRSGRNRNNHVSLVLWDLMFRIWKFLGVPSFTDSSKHSKNEVNAKYILDNDRNIANELQDLIDCVFRRASFVVQPHDSTEEGRSKLIPIIHKWQEYITNPLGNSSHSTTLGEIQARCGHLIGMKEKFDRSIEYDYTDFELRRKNLILFKPSETRNEWIRGLAFSDETREGFIPIFVPSSGEKTDEF